MSEYSWMSSFYLIHWNVREHAGAGISFLFKFQNVKKGGGTLLQPLSRLKWASTRGQNKQSAQPAFCLIKCPTIGLFERDMNIALDFEINMY